MNPQPLDHESDALTTVPHCPSKRKKIDYERERGRKSAREREKQRERERRERESGYGKRKLVHMMVNLTPAHCPTHRSQIR